MAGARSTQVARRCRLDQSAGRIRPCVEGDCPFWEPGGAALEGRCAFESVDFDRDPELVPQLLRLRERLASARSDKEARDARELFLRLLGKHPVFY
jgi:hypothetical protein